MHFTTRDIGCIKRTFWCSKVQHIAVVLEHVHLLDASNWLHVQLLQRTLQPLIILCAGVCGFLDHFPARCALATLWGRTPSQVEMTTPMHDPESIPRVTEVYMPSQRAIVNMRRAEDASQPNRSNSGQYRSPRPRRGPARRCCRNLVFLARQCPPVPRR